jgi:hypothetical protein
MVLVNSYKPNQESVDGIGSSDVWDSRREPPLPSCSVGGRGLPKHQSVTCLSNILIAHPQGVDIDIEDTMNHPHSTFWHRACLCTMIS